MKYGNLAGQVDKPGSPETGLRMLLLTSFLQALGLHVLHHLQNVLARSPPWHLHEHQSQLGCACMRNLQAVGELVERNETCIFLDTLFLCQALYAAFPTCHLLQVSAALYGPPFKHADHMKR